MSRRWIALGLGFALAVPAGGSLAADERPKTGRTPIRSNATTSVNLNKAEAKALMALGFDQATARGIVAYRTKNGPFQKYEDLLKVRGVTKEKLESVKGRVSLK